MKEPASTCSAQGPLMVGPDNAVYVISKDDRAAHWTAGPAGSPTSPGIPAAQDIQVRSSLRTKLGRLPQMGNAGPC